MTKLVLDDVAPAEQLSKAAIKCNDIVAFVNEPILMILHKISDDHYGFYSTDIADKPYYSSSTAKGSITRALEAGHDVYHFKGGIGPFNKWLVEQLS